MIRAFVLLATLALAFSASIDDQLASEWELFKKTYKRAYEPDTEAYRNVVFQNNLLHIQKHNVEADLGNHTFWLGVNEYTDWVSTIPASVDIKLDSSFAEARVHFNSP
jgi:hypothetical protein